MSHYWVILEMLGGDMGPYNHEKETFGEIRWLYAKEYWGTYLEMRWY